MSVGSYHSHNYRKFFGDNKGNTVPFLGVELEVDANRYENDTDDVSDGVEQIFPRNFIVFENDGSLNYGFENITAPATFEYHKSIFQNYCDAFRYIVSEGFFSYNTHSCGYHIHFNRDFFTSKENTENLLYIFDKFWNEIELLSRRDHDQITNWARKYDDSPKTIVENMDDYSRYHCVNLDNYKTIEIRIFKGTLNPYVFFAILAFVNNIIMISRYKTRGEINNMSWEDILPEETKVLWEKVKNRKVY